VSRILVVDDEPSMRELLSLMLPRRGMTITYWVAREHGGDIVLRSVPDWGTEADMGVALSGSGSGRTVAW
jgi:CheY-like chemotaxis protein